MPETDVSAWLADLTMGCAGPSFPGELLSPGAQQPELDQSVLGPDDALTNNLEALRVSFEDGVEALRPVTTDPDAVAPVQADPVEAPSSSSSPFWSDSPARSSPPAIGVLGDLPHADSSPLL